MRNGFFKSWCTCATKQVALCHNDCSRILKLKSLRDFSEMLFAASSREPSYRAPTDYTKSMRNLPHGFANF